ncbi:MAG TPA: DUF4268 domain-containing protein [Candidatus Coatesbacteria bacterium]|nr:DUF4268 domain-containing protein [Candidatus Coatesbacteria bacterium]
MIGKIKRVPLREVWKNEARDFTPWLEANIEALGDVLDLSLSSAERERPTGDFNVDLVAENDAGGTLAIENQLGKSDHDHLGKLITYLASLEADAAVWIVAEPRTEHVNAINWLNEATSGAFYLVKVEAVQIEDSPPAPLFTLIVGPSEGSREIGETKKAMAERHIYRMRFWEELLKRAREKTNLHSRVTAGKYNWIGTGAGKSGLGLNYTVTQHESVIELYIDRGKGSEADNIEIFNKLLQSKDKIEEAFGSRLIWDELEGRRSCRVSYRFQDGGYRDEDKWPELHEKMVDAMIRFEKALRPFINKLK